METVFLSEKSQNTERRERAWGLCRAGIHKAQVQEEEDDKGEKVYTLKISK